MFGRCDVHLGKWFAQRSESSWGKYEKKERASERRREIQMEKLRYGHWLTGCVHRTLISRTITTYVVETNFWSYVNPCDCWVIIMYGVGRIEICNRNLNFLVFPNSKCVIKRMKCVFLPGFLAGLRKGEKVSNCEYVQILAQPESPITAITIILHSLNWAFCKRITKLM